jgi:hypothetical protein
MRRKRGDTEHAPHQVTTDPVQLHVAREHIGNARDAPVRLEGRRVRVEAHYIVGDEGLGGEAGTSPRTGREHWPQAALEKAGVATVSNLA